MIEMWKKAHEHERKNEIFSAIEVLILLHKECEPLRDLLVQDILRLVRAFERSVSSEKKAVLISDLVGLLDEYGIPTKGIRLNANKKESITEKIPRRSNQKRILLDAHEIAESGDHAGAIFFAESSLPNDLTYAAHILRANAAIARGEEEDWLKHINAYLGNFSLTPIFLEGSGYVFDRLRSMPRRVVTEGPMVSVIMPAWNAEKTVRIAAESILNQTWKNLELLIVDDCSDDSTWPIIQEIARNDSRVKVIKNKVNVGPYVSKNIALLQAKGEWITGHDADDWALPERLEKHLKLALAANAMASLTYMIRLSIDGKMLHFTQVGPFSFDGVARLASISAMFNAAWMRETLGYWDSVRFGADSEMIERARRLLGDKFIEFKSIGMICLEHSTSLTNHPVTGIRTQNGLSEIRKKYKASWAVMHDTLDRTTAFLPFPQRTRRYPTSSDHAVSLDVIQEILSDL